MRNRYVLIADLVAVVLCALGAFVLRLDWFFPKDLDFTIAFRFYVLAAVIAKPAVFFAFGLYRRFWRYAAMRDLLIVFVAVSASTVAMAVLVTGGLLFQMMPFFPRSILAIDWLLTLAAAGGVRMSVRLIAESFSTTWTSTVAPDAPKRVLVAGAGDAGALVVREIHKNPHLAMRAIGFLDDDPHKRRKRIYEVPVLGALKDLADIVVEHNINEVIIAMPKAPGGVVRAVLQSCQQAGVSARALPGMFELLDGGVSVNRLREVDIADLLRRRPIEARPEAGLYLQGQTVLITGAGGSIGAELARQVARAQVAELILLGHGENSIFDVAAHLRAAQPAVKVEAVIADIRDATRLTELLRRYRPSVVFHAAAHKHVPLMEAHPEEAVTNNVVGTRNLVAAAIAAGVNRFVLISTDKAVQPASVMGATKRVAELIVHDAARRHGRRFLAVRFGNVLGSRGSVVPYFKQQIEHGGPVTVTHPDMKRFFMTIPEAVYLVVKAGGMAAGGELFVLNMGDAVKITDLASDLIHLSGLSREEIPIVYSGLRPGEKLEEALWEPESRIEPADGPDMFRVWEPEPAPTPATLTAAIDALDRAARQGDVMQIHRLLSDLLPSFVSPLAHGGPRAWT